MIREKGNGHIAAHDLSSGDETSAHLKRFHANRHAWLQALEDAGYQYDLLTTEQMAAGKLADYRVLILPDSIALTDLETDTMRKFVEGGGLLLADAETALLNGHGRWQVAGRLDDVLGVQRVQVPSAGNQTPTVKFRVALSSSTPELEVAPANPDLRLTTGHPSAGVGDALFLIDNRYGSGRAITLNFWMNDYDEIRKTPAQAGWLSLLRDYMNLAGVRPVAEVRRSDGSMLACSEVIGFQKEVAKFLAILPDPGCADEGPITLNVSETAYVFDLRAHRPLGRLNRITSKLVAGEPLLLAFLPAPVGRIKIAASGSQAGSPLFKPGDAVRLSVRLMPPNAPAGSSRAATAPPTALPPSAVHIGVRNPQGILMDYYGANLPVVNGQAEFTLPLALNDVPGVWRVTVREPYAHQTASATLVVRK